VSDKVNKVANMGPDIQERVAEGAFEVKKPLRQKPPESDDQMKLF